MRPELETYHLIDRYLRNELSGEELAEFESNLKSDTNLSKELEMQKLLNSVVIGAAYEDIRLQMKQDLPKIKHSSGINKWWLWSAIGLCSLVGLYLIYPSEPTTTVATKEVSNTSVNSPEKIQNIAVPTVTTEANTKKVNPSKIYSTAGTTSKPKIEHKSTESSKVEQISEASLESPIQEVTATQKSDEVSLIPEKITEKPDCKLVNIPLTPKIEAACAGEKNGKLSFQEAPHSLKISKEKSIISSSQPVFYHLSAGEHSFTIKDENGCTSIQQFVVPEKTCKPNKYAFNPELGETWKLPILPNDEFTITIRSKNGLVIFEQHSKSTHATEWTGTNPSGGILDPGMYIYTIEYSDGRKENGQVSIIK